MDKPQRQEHDDDDDSKQTLDWFLPVTGVRPGVDTHIDVLFFLSAGRLWRGMYGEAGAQPVDDPLHVNSLRQPMLRTRTAGPSRVQLLSRVDRRDPYWVLPDLDWNEAVYVAFRIPLDNDNIQENDHIFPAHLSFKADAVNEDGASIHTVGMDCDFYVPVLSEAEQRARGQDPAVVATIDRLSGLPPHVVRLRRPLRS